MTKALPGKKSVLVQIKNDADAKLLSTESQADIQARTALSIANINADTAISIAKINSENANKQIKLQENISILQALQHQATLDVTREEGELNRDLQQYLAEMNSACQRNEGMLNRELQYKLADLNWGFQANEGQLNREHSAQLEVLRAELQKFCLAQQRQLQLELKQLDALLAREIAQANRETAIATIVKQKNLENSPILVTAENLIANINPEDTPILRVFLSPPVLTHDAARPNQNFPVSEEFLSNYLRNFLDKYITEGRPVQFMGGYWRSNVFREEAAAENLFAGLRVIPTLILDSSATPDDFYLRFGFWHINFKKYRYQTPIHQLPWVEVLYDFAKQRAVNWQGKRQAYIDSGKPVADFDSRYGEETVKGYQQNLRILEIERGALEEGEDLSEIHRPYHLHKNDYNDLAEFIGIFHALIAGLIVDEYCLIFLPPNEQKTPLLPQLLPEMLAKMPAEEQETVIEIAVGYYQALYDNLAEEQSALIPDLRLDLAVSLLSLADKQWAAAQLYLSVQDWLKLHGLPIPEQSQLLNALAAALTIDDLPYVTKLNQCLQGLGADLQLSAIESCWQRGLQRANNGEYSSAITDFYQVLQLDSSRLDANIQRGLAYYQVCDYEGAIADFDLVLRLNPNDAHTYHHRGLVYHKLGQLEQAIEDFNRALQIDPSLPGVLHIRDVALGTLEERKREAEAERQRQEEEKRARQRREAEAIVPQRQAAAAEPLHREEEASKGKPFTFKIIKVDKYGKQSSKKSGKAYQKEEDLGKGVKLEMVHIPAGSFMMGSPSGEGNDNERPQHQVTFAQPFYIGKYPITQKQWQAVMGYNPSDFKGAKRPVEQVAWNDAVSFCQRLSKKTGKNYRLPSEAEWEYACRAGTSTAFHFGETITPDLVNYDGNNPYGSAPKRLYRQETTAVGSFPPNTFGLYDMHGNVWEWCADPWHGDYNGAPSDGSSWETGGNDYRVQRGGSWNNNAVDCRAADRHNSAGYSYIRNRGFRVVEALALPSAGYLNGYRGVRVVEAVALPSWLSWLCVLFFAFLLFFIFR
ncbi:SUMF1/EgtB/PvdO family nonheme iron enzyme [Microcoleus sp. B4-C1]|uniref:SUMF1/EgtB/PvdO family nonheme iron enzyme n=1 Tax=Microcoleus sp. B4-C1 TaxID=2818660 RepID=UPI002FD0AEAE